jgi:hypothetical protein
LSLEVLTVADEPTTKPELLARIDERWGTLQALLTKLAPAEQERPLGDGWSAKVHLAHLALWERSLMGLLRKQDRGEAMGVPAELWSGHDTDAINNFVAERSLKRSLSEVTQESAQVHAELTEMLRSMPQEDLEKPYSHYQPSDPPHNPAPVVGWVHGNTWDHYNEHIGWLEAGLKG